MRFKADLQRLTASPLYLWLIFEIILVTDIVSDGLFLNPDRVVMQIRNCEIGSLSKPF